MRLCGLMRYYQLFPAAIPRKKAGSPRVTHPSATNKWKFHPKIQSPPSVRLACVRHAASVHPEPGSNSHVKMISKPLPRFRRSKALCPFLADQTLTVISYLSSGYTLKCIVLYFSEFLSTLPRPALDSCVSCSCGWSWNLQGCISVRLSNRCSGFHQRACRTGPFLCASPWETQLRHHIICISVCQQLFYFFFLLPQNQML